MPNVFLYWRKKSTVFVSSDVSWNVCIVIILHLVFFIVQRYRTVNAQKSFKSCVFIQMFFVAYFCWHCCFCQLKHLKAIWSCRNLLTQSARRFSFKGFQTWNSCLSRDGTLGHRRRKGFFQAEPKVVKFHFSHSKLKKQLFLLKI